MASSQKQKPPSRQTWDREAMKNAILAIRENRMGYLKAAKFFNVPKTTLIRLSKNRDLPLERLTNIKLGRRAVLPDNLEVELVNYILTMEQTGFGLTRRDIKSIAYQVAVRNNLSNPFSRQNNSAGKTWLKLFLARHSNLSFRRPTGTSIARLKGFNKESVTIFFNLLEKEMDDFKYLASNIYNVDETGISVLPNKMPQILSPKGKKQIAVVTSAERGSTITCIICMNAAGSFVPPMMIFPRKRDHPLLMNGAPAGSIHACHPSGWIQAELFTKWFKHFLETTKPSATSPVLLILDGHTSHTRNIEVIDLARKNNVHLLSIPPHSSHKIQPLDKTFMGPLKKYMAEEIRVWMRANGRAITHYDIASIFGRAYVRSQCAELAISGFRTTGIYPLNRHVFKDHDFIETSLDDKPDTDQVVHDNGNAAADPSENQTTREDQSLIPNPLPGPSTAPAFITPENISPIPRLNRTKSNRGRKASKATLLTSSPYKLELEKSFKEKKEINPETSKRVKELLDIKSPKEKKHATVRKIVKKRRPCKSGESSSSEDSSNFSVKDSSDEDPDPTAQENAACLYCDGLFSEDACGELWVQCVSCSRWAHEDCSGVEKDIFVCEFCSSR